MDLLRLVLAHQPYARLEGLPKLLGNPKFVKLRTEFINTSPRQEGESYRNHCIRDGELFPSLDGSARRLNICNRAVFLLNPSAVEMLSGDGVDFWYCLSTSIPEIQDIAIANISGGIDNLRNYNNLYEIPWTPELEAKLLRYKDQMLYTSSRNKYSQLHKLLGVLGVEIENSQVLNYYEGRIWRILRGEVVVDKRDNIEILLQRLRGYVQENWLIMLANSGYLYPIINSSVAKLIIRDVAFVTARKELFKYVDIKMLRYPTPITYFGDKVITRQFVVRIREILDDPYIVEKLLTPDLRLGYRILVGEILPGRESIRILVNNGYVPGNGIYGQSAVSLQNLVLYDPVPYIARGIARAECYKRGIVP